MIYLINFAPCFKFIIKMKNLSYLLLAMFMLGVSACGSKKQPKETAYPMGTYGIDTTLRKTTIKFDATQHAFGKVREGEKVVYVYKVLNTGKADLLIQSVRPSCGCTTPKYDKQPIRPGKKGSIEVIFNTKGRPGNQHKTVLVVTNTEPPNTVLSFTCEVEPAEKTDKDKTGEEKTVR